MITKSMIEKRLEVLNSDIENTRKKISELEQQKLESVALLNALMGAKQQYKRLIMLGQNWFLTQVMWTLNNHSNIPSIKRV